MYLSSIRILRVIVFGGLAAVFLFAGEPTFAGNPKRDLDIQGIRSATVSSDGATLSVCFNLVDADRHQSVHTLAVPIKDQGRWNIKKIVTRYDVARTLIKFRPTLADFRPGCNEKPVKLAVIRYTRKDYYKQMHARPGSALVALKPGLKQALYAVYRDSLPKRPGYGSPMDFGYASSRPLLKNGYTIGVNLYPSFYKTLWACGRVLLVDENLGNRKFIKQRDKHGWTALHCAARFGDIRRAKLLLENGARVNATTSKDATPLFLAATTKNAELVKLLIRHKANVNAETEKGGTALLMAARVGDPASVKVLLENGANHKYRDPRGYTAMKWASVMGHKEVVQVMRELGVKK